MIAQHPRRRVTTALGIGLMAIAALLVTACSDGDGAPDTISGLITELRVDDREQPVFLKVRTADGTIWELAIEFDPDAAISSAHLEEHRARRLPVVVHVRESASGLYAARINDAPP